MSAALLTVKDLCAGYGSSQVLFDIEFKVDAGEVITLLGRNGMGKSTTVKCLAGLLAPSRGSIQFAGQEVAGAAAYVVGRLGFGLVPEGRQVFPTLTVYENLVATANTRNVAKSSGANSSQNVWNLERVHHMFPILAQRAKQQAGMLSGGEQQMLAIGRALMTNPRLLVLDEATEGLAPLIREDIWRCLGVLKEQGQAMIVIDKNLKPLLQLAQRHYVFEKGRIVFVANQGELADPEATLQKYLHV